MADEVVIRVKTEGTAQAVSDVQKVEKSFLGLGKTAGAVGKIAGGVLTADLIKSTAQSVISSVGGMVTAFNEQARAETQLNAVLLSTGGVAGVTAEAAKSLASELQGLTRYEDDAVLGAENLLLTFTRIGKDIFPDATRIVLDMSTALGQDLKSSSIQVGKALNDPIAGITALTRVGVTFSAAQKEQIKTLVESGRGMEAQKIILAELKREFGGSATNLTAFERAMDSAKDTINETKEKLGALVVGGFNLLSGWLSEHKEDIGNFFRRLAPIFEFVKNEVQTRIGAIIQHISLIAKAVGGVVNVVIDLANGRWKEAWNGVKDTAVNIGKLMINSLVLMFGQLPNIMISAVEQGINGMIGLLNSIPEIKTPAWLDKIPGGLGLGNETIMGGFNIPKVDLPQIPTRVFDIEKALEGLGEAAGSAIPPVNGIGEGTEDFGAAAAGAGEKAKTLGDRFMGMLDSLRSAASAIFSRQTVEEATLQLKLVTAQSAWEQARVALDSQLVALDSHLAALQGRKAGLPGVPDAQMTEFMGGASPAVQARFNKNAQDAHDAAVSKRDEEIAAIDRQIASKEREIAAVQGSIKAEEAKIAAMQREASLMDMNNQKQQLRLTLADQTLLTEAQQNSLTNEFVGRISTATGMMNGYIPEIVKAREAQDITNQSMRRLGVAAGDLATYLSNLARMDLAGGAPDVLYQTP
jgi:hypothetical protein